MVFSVLVRYLWGGSVRVVVSTDNGAVNGANTVLSQVLSGLRLRGWDIRLFLDDPETNAIFSRARPAPDEWLDVFKDWQPDLAVAMHGKILRFAKRARQQQVPVLWLCHQASWVPVPGGRGQTASESLPVLAPMLFDRVVVPSEGLRKHLDMGDRAVVVRNGVDAKTSLEAALRDGGAFRRRFGLNSHEPVTGYAARWVPYKAHKEVLELFAGSDLPGKLVLAGSLEGKRSEEPIRHIHERVRALGLTDRVIVCNLGYQEMAGFYGALDLFMSTSRFESFGVVKIEAMASGTPVVALAEGGAGEVLDGYWGCCHSVEEVGQKSLRVLEDAAFRRAFSIASWEFVAATFSAKAMVRSYDREFQSLLN